MTQAECRIEGAADRCKDCGAVATCHVQGETYSFGTEWWRLCDDCAHKASEPGQCEWCGKETDQRRPVRDWEECCGFGDRVDWVCGECGRRERESFDSATAPQASEREVLIDHRDELAAMVRARKLELRAALERRRNHGCGSAKAMWQMLMAIGQGQSQIAVIDLQLESLGS